MPLVNFNMTQNATTIFFDNTHDADMLEGYIRHFFAEGEYLFQHDDIMTGRELFDFLQEKRVNRELVPVPGGRLLICFHMMLKDLTDEWIDDFFEMARVLRTFAPLNDLFDHHYMVFLKVRAGFINDLEEKKNLNRLIIRLGTETPNVSHQIYLLRTAGVGATFRSQEKAVACLAHMLSRRGYNVALPTRRGTPLRMVDSADYYTARAAHCNEKIGEIDNWLGNRDDEDLNELRRCIRVELQGADARLVDAVKKFQKETALFPVPAKSYEGNIISGFHRVLSKNNPILRDIRREFSRSTEESLVRTVSFDEIGDLLTNNYCYNDFLELQNQIDDGRLKQACIMDDNASQNEEREHLFRALYEKAEEVIRSNLPNIDSRRQRYQSERMRYIGERAIAGRYVDITDCFQRINQDLEPRPIAGQFAEVVGTTALISGEPATNWQIHQYQIAGVHTAYRYPVINPCEIFMLKESDIVDLAAEDAARRLMIIY